MPAPFYAPVAAQGARRRFPQLWLTNAFRRFCAPFYEPDEAFEGYPERPKGFPLGLLLPITAPPAAAFSGIWMANTAAETIYVLNGPNLNLLGTREPDTYGHATLADVEKLCAETSAQFGLKADCRQSNREGELIDFIHEAHARKAAGIIINAGGYSHTSIALHDALVAVKIPSVEVHISNIHARENFRHHSFTAKAAFATLSGFGIDGYRLAINGLAARIGAKAKA
jgi:3-dehydroquinate dehydratase-2